MTKLRLLCSIPLITALSVAPFFPIQFTLSRGLELGNRIAQAQPAQSRRVRWTPQRKMGSVRNTISGGRRGRLQATCESGSQPTKLSLLVPNEQEGLYTMAAQPSLFWHVNTAQAVSARFILSDPNHAEPVFTQTLPIQKAGIAQIKLPQTAALTPGTQYRWTVILACKNGSEVHARSFIQRLDATVPAGTELDQAIAYAKSGIWYDALNSLMQAYRQDSSNATVQAELKSLLTQGGNPEVAQIHFLSPS